MCFVFFFSSRRRHTRLQGDWSSDVCSSDLLFIGEVAVFEEGLHQLARGVAEGACGGAGDFNLGVKLRVRPVDGPGRSEERRGGKGRGGRWTTSERGGRVETKG